MLPAPEAPPIVGCHQNAEQRALQGDFNECQRLFAECNLKQPQDHAKNHCRNRCLRGKSNASFYHSVEIGSLVVVRDEDKLSYLLFEFTTTEGG